MNSLSKKIIGALVFVSMFFSVQTVLAQSSTQDVSIDIGNQLQAAGGPTGAGLGQPVDPRVVVANIFRVFAGLISIILIGINVYAGYIWMTAGGNEEQVTKAKTLMRNAVIGLIVVLGSYSITIFAANLARGYQAPYMEGGILGLFGFH